MIIENIQTFVNELLCLEQNELFICIIFCDMKTVCLIIHEN